MAQASPVSRDVHSAVGAAAVTPSDTTVFARLTRALVIGTAGNVAIRTAEGDTVTIVGMAAGQILPVQCDKVMSTNTTAGSIVALF